MPVETLVLTLNAFFEGRAVTPFLHAPGFLSVAALHTPPFGPVLEGFSRANEIWTGVQRDLDLGSENIDHRIEKTGSKNGN
jgi:hypothetical protein